MAGTRVRLSRGSFAGTSPISLGTWSAGSEKYLVAFIALQTLEFAWLCQTGGLDLPVAFCLSASLLAGARMFTKQRTEPLPREFATERIPAHAQSVAAQTAQIETNSSRVCQPIAIDEQSQTWAELMARISHEIRTPLNAVIGFSDLMEREIFGPLGNARYRDYAAHIKDSGDALLRSAGDTLALSSLLATPAPGHRIQSSSLAALTRDAWHFIEPQAARRGIRLEVTIPEALEVAGDRRAFRQVLSNLIMEATQRANSDTAILVRAETHGDTVRVEVAAPHSDRHRHVGTPSIALCVARALLELQGTSLATSSRAGQFGWQAATVLDLAVQPDFFQRG